jgi:hypothetical protein
MFMAFSFFYSFSFSFISMTGVYLHRIHFLSLPIENAPSRHQTNFIELQLHVPGFTNG